MPSNENTAHTQMENDRLNEEVKRLKKKNQRLIKVCKILDSFDLCEGYSFRESDHPKLWKVLELARKELRGGTHE